MEREKALEIAKLAYKEVIKGIEETKEAFEEFKAVDISISVPAFISVEDHEFHKSEL